MKPPAPFPAPSLSLAGTWRCRIEGRGDQLVQLPGSLAVQRLGDPVTLATSWTGTIFNPLSFESPDYAPYREPGNIKFPFWLQPETVYVGEACFERDFEIPEDWCRQRIVLSLERPHWFTRVWLDDRELGSGDSLSTPHRFELGSDVAPGLHRLRIQVDNRIQIAVGENAHSVSDHTQGNWNGIIGRLELTTHRSDRFVDIQVYPRVSTRSVGIRGRVDGSLGGMVTLSVGPGPALAVPVGDDGCFTAEYPLGQDAALWDEFSPRLHTLLATLEHEGVRVDSRTVRFGLREIATADTRFLLNGRPVFFRGTLECCVFPLTGHPPMDVDSWLRALRVVKEHGLNHVRFHSWCPPEAAFIAGDELGLYFQVEVATWPNTIAVEAGSSPAGIGDGATIDQWVYAESTRILREYGNHPCFVLMAAGNEPGGPGHVAYLGAWVAHFRALDSRRLFTGTAGWPELPGNQFHVIPEPRGHQWLDGLRSRLNALPPATDVDYRASVAGRSVPLISHEIGQWCSYPPLNDAAGYNGHLKPRNYEIFAASLAARGMAGLLDDFVRASGKLQALCYREEIEAALRTPGMGGFQLLDLRDFPGQGTAPVGVLNAFWGSKGYITADQFRRFCAPTVLLARLPRRVFTSAETLKATIEIAHFGPTELENARLSWRLLGEDDVVLGSGSFPPVRISFGSGVPLGELAVDLGAVSAPVRGRLLVHLDDSEITNDWDVWIYPVATEPAPPDDVSVFHHWNNELEAVLARGGKVLLLPPERVSEGAAKGVELGFTPIFWNTWCTKGQAPHTLGVLCDPEHAAFASFPTDSHTNWHWWYLLSQASAMVLDDLPSDLKPIVRVIDDWYSNRRLGLLFEAQVGGGKLLACGIRLTAPAQPNPVARQFLASVFHYMSGSAFQPSLSLPPGKIAILHAAL